MTYTQKRKLDLDGSAYEWCIRGNDLYASQNARITIYMSGTKGAPLYLDPYPWDLVIRPKVVAEAIRFAQAHGWVAGQKGPPVYIGYHDQQFIMLPDKVTTTREYLQGL